MFHPSAFGVRQLIRHQYGYLLSSIYPKRSGKWLYWYIVKISFDMMVKCSLIQWNLLLFDRNLFNVIARELFNCFVFVWFICFVFVWFNCSPHNYTLIFLIVLERDLTVFLMIFLSLILFILWGYTITMDCNVRNVVKM